MPDWRKRTRGSSVVVRETETGSNKDLVISTDTPVLQNAEVASIYVKYTATTTVGTRQLLISCIAPDGNNRWVWQGGTGAEIAASETKEITYCQDGGSLGAYNGQEQSNVHMVPLPSALTVQDGDKINIKDIGNSGSAYDASDTLEVSVNLISNQFLVS